MAEAILSEQFENSKEDPKSIKIIIKLLTRIEEKEPEVVTVLLNLIKHITKTYDDKYQSEITNVINTKHILTKMEEGKWVNLQNSAKYLQRYYTSGFSKSGNVEDLYKAMHYILFEITRRINTDVDK